MEYTVLNTVFISHSIIYCNQFYHKDWESL